MAAVRSGLGGSRERVWGVGLGLGSRAEAGNQDLVKPDKSAAVL